MRLKTISLVAFAAALAFGLAPALLEAKVGNNQSSGSRGARTERAAPSTPTTPNAARPVERSATAPGQAARPGTPAAAQQPGFFQRNPILGGLLAGMVGAGLIGMLFGGGFNLAGLGGAEMFGFLIQLLLIGGGIYLVIRLLRARREQAAPAMASDRMERVMEPAVDVRPTAGGSAAPSPFAPKGGDEIGVQPVDFDVFQQRLTEIQTAWSQGDIAALRRFATPEMVSYFAEDLAANTSRGIANKVEGVNLDQGDLAEAWQEGATQYATVAMRWSAFDYDVSTSDGRVVSGDRHNRSESTEVWTFTRNVNGGTWILSAIQQV
jgi:predicted lipid-binding transport protein (Tim44 family)